MAPTTTRNAPASQPALVVQPQSAARIETAVPITAGAFLNYPHNGNHRLGFAAEDADAAILSRAVLSIIPGGFHA